MHGMFAVIGLVAVLVPYQAIAGEAGPAGTRTGDALSERISASVAAALIQDGTSEQGRAKLSSEAVIEWLETLPAAERAELVRQLTTSGDDDAGALYHAGRIALEAGDIATARRAFALLARAFPDDGRALAAGILARQLGQVPQLHAAQTDEARNDEPPWESMGEQPPGGTATAPRARLKPRDRTESDGPVAASASDELAEIRRIGAPAHDPDGGATELITVSTLYGVWSGVALSAHTDLDVGIALFATLGGGTATFGTAYGLSHTIDFSEGHAMALDIGAVLGTWHGLAIDALASNGAGPSDNVWLSTWAGSTFGVVGGIVAMASADLAVPTIPGDLALTSSGALWGAFFAAMSTVAFVPDLQDSIYAATLAGTDVGATALGVASAWVDTTRSRMALIDLCGVAGAALTSAALFVAYGEDGVPRGVFGGANLIAAGSAIALAAWLTEDLDDESEPLASDIPSLLGPTPYTRPAVSHDGRVGLDVGVHALRVLF